MKRLALALLLTGCAHAAPDWDAIHSHAADMSRDVNAIAEDLTPAGPIVMAICAIQGQESPACHVSRGVYSTAKASVDAAHKAIALYKATGIGLEHMQVEIGRAAAAVDALHSALESVGKAVSGVSGGENPEPVVDGPDGGTAAPTEGEGAAP